MLDDPLAKEEVLVPAAQRARRTFDDPALGDRLASLELLTCQVHKEYIENQKRPG